MSNHIRFFKAGILALLVWSMQMSFVVADQLPEINPSNLASSVASVELVDHQHDQTQSSVSEKNSCHPATSMNCEFEQCTSCLFYIAQEFVPFISTSSVSTIKPVSIESPRKIKSASYRPPQKIS